MVFRDRIGDKIKKRAFIALVIIAVVVGVILQFVLHDSADNATITIGYQPIDHHIAAMVAAERGWWEEDLARFGNKNVEMKEFSTGPKEMYAMLVGDIDIAYVGMAPPIAAMYEGLGSTYSSFTMAFSLWNRS